MVDPHVGTLTLVVFTSVIGIVVFGGTTLAYFLDKHRKHLTDSPRREPQPVRVEPEQSDRHRRAA